MTREEIINQGRPIEPNCFETDREEQWYNVGLYDGASANRWHNVLTGSCRMGRDEFAREHGIDVEGGKMTVREFVSLTEHSYGGKAVSSLRELYG